MPGLRCARRRARLAAIVVATALGGAVPVVSTAQTLLEIAAAGGDGWAMTDLRFELDLAADGGPSVTLTLASLEVAGAELTTVSARCAAVAISRRELRCDAVRLAFAHDGERREATAQLAYAAATRSLALVVPSLTWAGGRVSLQARFGPGGMALDLDGAGVELAPLTSVLAGLRGAPLPVTVEGGSADVRVAFDGTAERTLSVDATLSGLSFSDASGRVAGEGLTAHVHAEARGADAPAAWQGRVTLALNAGGLYAEPVYLDLSSHALSAETGFRYAPESNYLSLPAFRLEQADTVTLAGRFEGSPGQPPALLEVNVQDAQLPAFHDTWIAGALVGTPFAALDTQGRLSARAVMRDGAWQRADLELAGVDLEDRDGRLALYGVNGDLHWARDGADLSGSRLAFDGGFVHGAGFGAAALELGIAGGALDLLEPVRLPLLGGAVVVDTFTVRDYGSEDLALGLEASLEPIDLGRLTVALDWPPFTGTLSGRLPLLTYQRGVVTLGGTLEAQAFDGAIDIERLRIEQPLGIVPRIGADIRLRNLDLGRVTEVVPFGRVEGRLDGDIEGLRLLKGEPIAFDASFRTPPDDDSRHRISQRAVDTISRVAGGGAVLSTTFLRIFEHFAYDRLGISCRLVNDVCHMDGVGETDGGYYIVKGAFVPRIDLIGRVREVHWSRLMQQLEQALSEGEFRIE